jgi:hypothetical protein
MRPKAGKACTTQREIAFSSKSLCPWDLLMLIAWALAYNFLRSLSRGMRKTSIVSPVGAFSLGIRSVRAMKMPCWMHAGLISIRIHTVPDEAKSNISFFRCKFLILTVHISLVSITNRILGALNVSGGKKNVLYLDWVPNLWRQVIGCNRTCCFTWERQEESMLGCKSILHGVKSCYGWKHHIN